MLETVLLSREEMDEDGLDDVAMESMNIFRGVLTLVSDNVDELSPEAVVALADARIATDRKMLTKVAYAIDATAIWKQALDNYVDMREATDRLLPRLKATILKLQSLSVDDFDPTVDVILVMSATFGEALEAMPEFSRSVMPQFYDPFADLVWKQFRTFFHNVKTGMAAGELPPAQILQVHTAMEKNVNSLRAVYHDRERSEAALMMVNQIRDLHAKADSSARATSIVIVAERCKRSGDEETAWTDLKLAIEGTVGTETTELVSRTLLELFDSYWAKIDIKNDGDVQVLAIEVLCGAMQLVGDSGRRATCLAAGGLTELRKVDRRFQELGDELGTRFAADTPAPDGQTMVAKIITVVSKVRTHLAYVTDQALKGPLALKLKPHEKLIGDIGNMLISKSKAELQDSLDNLIFTGGGAEEGKLWHEGILPGATFAELQTQYGTTLSTFKIKDLIKERGVCLRLKSALLDVVHMYEVDLEPEAHWMVDKVAEKVRRSILTEHEGTLMYVFGKVIDKIKLRNAVLATRSALKSQSLTLDNLVGPLFERATAALAFK